MNNDVDLKREVYQYLSGQHGDLSKIAECVTKGDQIPVSSSLGSETVPISQYNTVPLSSKIKRSIKKIIDNYCDTHQLNKKGAAGWIDKYHCWVVSKRFTDDLRQQLESEGHTNVPYKNTRLFDVMAESGLIEKTPIGRSIWKINISLNNWKVNLLGLQKWTGTTTNSCNERVSRPYC